MNPPRIAATLICKNSEATLEQCLASIRPHVDGVFIYDTGSTDGTLTLIDRLNQDKLHRFGPDGQFVSSVISEGRDPEAEEADDAEHGIVRVRLAPLVVEQGEWRDDFAWARQQSFDMVPADFNWMLWLDDDDVIEGATWLRFLAESAQPMFDGYVFYYDYARDETGQNVCQLWRERLIRRDRGFVWKGAVHEVLTLPEGRPVHFAQVPPEQVRYVHHRTPDRYPSDRNLKILQAEKEKAEADDGEADLRTIAYLGTEHMARMELDRAVPYFEAYIGRGQDAWSDERVQVYHKLATCLRFLGNPTAAVEAEMRALRERDDWAETHIGLSQCFAAMGQWDRAERWARQGLALGMPRSSLILNPLEFTLLPLLTIADACVAQGNGEGARAAMGQAIQAFPANPGIRQKLEEIENKVAENDLVAAVLQLREVLVRHDENLKAHHLLENVPYLIAEHPEIVRARSDQREMVAHYLRPDEYARWYREEPKESTVPDEYVPEVGEHIPRAKRLLEGLREQEEKLGRKPRLLDLGANDMWVACYLWKQGGYQVDGVELNRQSYEKGLARMETFGAPGVLHHGDLHEAAQLARNGKGPIRYDAVSLFEVIEHVPYPQRTLDVCEKMLRPGGRIYLSTPNGAYERGAIEMWAAVERKGHLRAITAQDLSETAQQRGEIDAFELQHDGRVSFLAYSPRKRRGKVVFYAGSSWEPWSPGSIAKGGLGGSETALVRVAVHLAQAGWEVKVYSGAEPGFMGGVSFRTHTAWDPGEECDLLVVSRLPHVFGNRLGAKRAALWCHDHSYPQQLTPELSERMDAVVCLSEWQRERFARLYPFAADKLTVIRNGITLRGVFDGRDHYPHAERSFAERKPRCVFSSSADRGLDVMLALWPRIRENVPDAELHVFYGFNVFDRVAMVNPGLAVYKAELLNRVAELGGPAGGVYLRGRKGQPKLAAEMMRARVWTYPTAFLETSCIGAMEARAAGLPIVTSSLAALQETVGPHGLTLGWPGNEDEPFNQDEAYQEAFVAAVQRLLTDEAYWQGWHHRARRGLADLDWSMRVSEWEALARPESAKKRKLKRSRSGTPAAA